MSLSNTRTNWLNGSYENDRNANIKEKENSELFKKGTNLDAHDDKATSVAIGYGYDLIQNVNRLQTDLAPYIAAVQPNTTIAAALQNVRNLIDSFKNNTFDPNLSNDDRRRTELANEINQHITLSTETNATALLNTKVQTYETALTAALGTHDLPQSKERAALISLVYNLTNASSGAINATIPSTINAIANDNRAEAWYEIRYNSNAGQSRAEVGSGIANRRVTESNMFGLYSNDSANLTLDEAKNIARMYTLHQNKITNEESAFSNSYSGSNSINSQLGPIKTFLTTEISNQYELTNININGNVLVGRGLASYQNIRAEQNDTAAALKGTSNNDLIFAANVTTINAGEGNNIIIAGDKNQTFNAKSGNDIYIIEKQATSHSYIINDSNGNDKVILKGFKEEDIESILQNKDNDNLNITLKNASIITFTNWNLNDSRVEEIIFDDKTFNSNDILKYMQNAKTEDIRAVEGFDVYTNKSDNNIIIDKNSLKNDNIQVHAYGGSDTLVFKNFKTDDIKNFNANNEPYITLSFANDKNVTYINSTSINTIKFDDKTFTKNEFDEHLKSLQSQNTQTIQDSEQMQEEPTLTDLIIKDLAAIGVTMTAAELTMLANSNELKQEANNENKSEQINTNDNNNIMPHRMS